MKILFSILLIVTLASCTGVQPSTPGPDICLTKPADVKSWLCEASAKSGVTLNTVDGILLDASAIGVIAAKLNTEQIAKFLTKMESYLDIKSITYNALIDKMQLDAASAAAIQAIISRRIGMFASVDVISPYDIELIRLEIKRQRQQFGIV